MTDLLDAAFSERGRGGQRHLLATVLKKLSTDDAEKLRAILAADFDSINFPALHREMCDRGIDHSVSSWKRWMVDFKRNPERFD